MLNQVKQFVQGIYPRDPAHFERTVYWLLRLKPDADEAMQIAAYTHDVARAQFKPDENYWQKHRTDDPDYLKEHQELSAKIVVEFLKKENYAAENIKRVEDMILTHEIGGTPESDLIKDADSISFLEINVPKLYQRGWQPFRKERMKEKCDFMYNRISSNEAKKLAKPFYQKAMAWL